MKSHRKNINELFDDKSVVEWYYELDKDGSNDKHVYRFSIGKFTEKGVAMFILTIANYGMGKYFSLVLTRLKDDFSGSFYATDYDRNTVWMVGDSKFQFKLYATVMAIIKDFITRFSPKEISFMAAADAQLDFYRAATDRINFALAPIGYELTWHENMEVGVIANRAESSKKKDTPKRPSKRPPKKGEVRESRGRPLRAILN